MAVEIILIPTGTQQPGLIRWVYSSLYPSDDMDWKPIGEQMLREQLQREIEALPEYVRELFQKYSVPIYRLTCLRTADAGEEKVYVVARLENRVLFFDDVEDEYGVGTVWEGTMLKDWDLYGSLQAALVGLITEQNGYST